MYFFMGMTICWLCPHRQKSKNVAGPLVADEANTGYACLVSVTARKGLQCMKIN